MRNLLLALMMFMLMPIASWATPPSEVTVSYDQDKQVLHVEAKHPSDRLERHFLRVMKISHDATELKTVTFPRQTLAWGLSTDVDLPTKGGEHIKVELFCSQGGHKDATIDIPEPPVDEKSGAKAVDLKDEASQQKENKKEQYP